MDLEPFGRLLVAAALTALIGVDRELRAKPAGLRTNIVVGIATAAFALAGASAQFGGGDPTRVAAQIVSGIGFLGGGAIFAAGGKPHGLTTAAALWGSAAVGLASGIGAFDIALAVVAVTLVALWPLDRIAERLIGPRARTDVRVHVVMHGLDPLEEVQRCVEASEPTIVQLDLRTIDGSVVAQMVLEGRREQVARLIDSIEHVEGVRMVGRQSGSVTVEG